MKLLNRSYFNPNLGGYWLLIGIFSLLFMACDELPILEFAKTPPKQTPREAYLSALDSNGLAHTQMAKSWRLAGTMAFTDSIVVEAPFSETGYVRAENPEALAYRIDLKVGELLQIQLVTEPDSILFFADLFLARIVD